jgi:hypothetical protein
MTDITELAQSLKATAEKAFDHSVFTMAVDAYSIIALVDELEKAQAKNALVAGGIEAATKLHERMGSLTSENAALKGSVENAAGCINAAYAEGLIDALAESSDERLVDLVKRRLLHAYLPVETPATDDVLVAMGDAVLLEQLECGGKAIISQSNIIGLQANRIAELESFRTAYMEWSDKTDWVNTDRRFGVVKPLGKHRADVLKAYIEHLESRTVTVKPEDADGVREEGNQFLVVRHPGKVPVIKHPVGQLEDFLLQILKADPLATIDIVTHRYYGAGGQFVKDADEYLHEMGIREAE